MPDRRAASPRDAARSVRQDWTYCQCTQPRSAIQFSRGRLARSANHPQQTRHATTPFRPRCGSACGGAGRGRRRRRRAGPDHLRLRREAFAGGAERVAARTGSAISRACGTQRAANTARKRCTISPNRPSPKINGPASATASIWPCAAICGWPVRSGFTLPAAKLGVGYRSAA